MNVYNPHIAINISIINSGNSVDIELIPYTLTPEGCANKRNYRQFQLGGSSRHVQTCVCEDHCSWDMCNLAHPPQGCLRNTTSNWYWDSVRDTWIAQVDLGNNVS